MCELDIYITMLERFAGDEKQKDTDRKVRAMLYNVARGKCSKETREKVKGVLKSGSGLKQVAGLGVRTVFQHPVKSALSAAGLYAAGKTVRSYLG